MNGREAKEFKMHGAPRVVQGGVRATSFSVIAGEVIYWKVPADAGH